MISTKYEKYGNSSLFPDLNLKMTRLDEKHALQHIHDRFSNYTSRVNQLTDTNQKLESLLVNSKLTEEELKTIKEMYEAELKESRHLLENNGSELAKKHDLQLKTAAMVRDLSSRLDDEQAVRKKSDENLLCTEQALAHKEKLLLAAFREHDEDRRTIAQAMREKDEIRSTLAASKKGHERETVLRVEAENCVNATRQELAFVKEVHNAEIQSLKDKISDLEIINTNLERDLRQEFEHRLQSDLSEARARLDKLAAAQKNEYESKMRQKLKQAQTQQEQDGIRQNTLNDANGQLRIQNDALKAQVNNLIGKNNALEDTLRNTTHSLEHERSHNALTLTQSLGELKELKDKFHIKCLECDELQDARIPLQEEISNLKENLDQNESLLKYRTEVQTVGRHRPVTASQLSGQKISSSSQRFVSDDVKRAPSAASAASAPARTKEVETVTDVSRSPKRGQNLATHSDSTSFSTGSVKIWDVHDRGDYVRLVNTSNHDEYLGGCVIQQTVSDSAFCSYKFPHNFVLRGGAMCTIWSNQSQALHNPPSDLLWKDQEAWAIGPDVNTVLYKPNGQASTGLNNTTAITRRPKSTHGRVSPPGVTRDQGPSRDRVIKTTLDERSMGFSMPPAASSPNILSYKQNRNRDDFLAASDRWARNNATFHDYPRPKSAF